jgi:hypothetical protein
MTEPPHPPGHDRDAARHDRLRDALRENLKRRKSQLRGRATLPTGSAEGDPAPGPKQGDRQDDPS